MMCDKLVKRLRYCSEEHSGCGVCELSDNCVLRARLLLQAADAIEELSLTAESYKRSMEVWADEVAKAQPRWIPVTERLPKEIETVIVTDGKNVGFSFCVNDYGTLEFYSPWNITHWMPLPEPPKEET